MAVRPTAMVVASFEADPSGPDLARWPDLNGGHAWRVMKT